MAQQQDTSLVYNIGGWWQGASSIDTSWAKSITGDKPMQPLNMTWVVAGKRYCTDTATLLAHDEYWNGYSCEQGGRNTFLFRTPNGNFFAQHQTLLPREVETGKIVTLEIDEAVSLYHSLYKKEVPFAVAFPSVKAKDA